MNFPFVKYYKIHYLITGLLVIATIAALVVFHLNLGIDFLGGTIWEVNFESRPDNAAIRDKLAKFDLGEFSVQPTGENGVILRMKNIDEKTHQEILSALKDLGKAEEKRFETIGPTIGKELRQKTILLIIVSLIALLIYIAVAFRKLKWPIAGWQYGLVSVITLAIDVLIPLLVLILLGKFYNVQFTIPIVTALLTIVGYTMNDKVIVFDRVRENLLKTRVSSFSETVNQSLNQIFFRSLSTGACTQMVLLMIFIFGGETLKYFALTLIIGIVVGTYTSLFIASALLISWSKKFHQ